LKVTRAPAVILAVPSKITLQPLAKVSGVVAVVRPLANLTVLPYAVVNMGYVVAPPKVKLAAEVQLKLIVPVPVTAIVPVLVPIVIGLAKFITPVAVLISSVATAVLLIQVMVPARLKVPLVLFILQTRVTVLLVPVKITLPLTFKVPLPMATEHVKPLPVGWFKVTLPVTFSVTPEASMHERLFEEVFIIRFVTVVFLLIVQYISSDAPVEEPI